MPTWLTVVEAAQVLSVSPDTLWRWCRSGSEPATLFAARWGARGWRVNRERLEAFMAGELVGSAP